MYASCKCEKVAQYRLFLLEKLKRHFKNTAYIYLKGFTSSKRLSKKSFNIKSNNVDTILVESFAQLLFLWDYILPT